MLKKISKLLVLGSMVCAGSACVTPTHASSAPLLQSTEVGVVITHIYSATPAGAAHELIAIYNTTDDSVDITNWCIQNKTPNPLICFKNGVGETHLIEPRGRVVLVSEEYAAANSLHGDGLYDIVFTVANKTSGSLVGSNDVVRLSDAVGRVVDEWSWTSTAPKGQGYIRNGFDENESGYLQGSMIGPALLESVYGGALYREDRLNDEDESGGVDYAPPLPEYNNLRITEILPDPDGADSGSEFIEIHNDGEVPVSLHEYSLRVRGGSSDKVYRLPKDVSVDAGEYYVVSNSDIKYSLNNTAGSVQLMRDGAVTEGDGIVEYSAPPAGQSWSFFSDENARLWSYTTLPTPGAANVLQAPALVAPSESVQKPCNADQFRNPETGRCKKLSTAKAATPCKSNQYRSEETGRCRNVAVAKAATPCKEGQERNPETNRCRNIKKMTSASHGLSAVEAKEASGGIAWYAWVVVIGVVLGVLVYAVWEWRDEVRELLTKLRSHMRP